MRQFKIVHRERNSKKQWVIVSSLIPAENEDQAKKKLDRHPSLILGIIDLGEKKKIPKWLDDAASKIIYRKAKKRRGNIYYNVDDLLKELK